MKQLNKLYVHLFLVKNKVLMIMGICLFISIFSFGINIFQTNESDDQQKYYFQYIMKYEGLLTKKKENEIDKEKKYFEKENPDYLEMYKNHLITKDDYIDNINNQIKMQIKYDGFKKFYNLYLKVKNNNNLKIINQKYFENMTFRNIDILLLFFTLYLIYIIFLKDIDDKITIYEKTTIVGRKECFKSKAIIFSCIIATYISIVNLSKIFLLKQQTILNFSILNLDWVGKNCINISFIQLVLICSILYFLGCWVLCLISIFIRNYIKNNILILIFLFLICYISQAFFGNNMEIVYIPAVSFFVPGRYFAGYGEKMISCDIRILVVEMAFSFFILIFILYRFRNKLIYISIILSLLLTGCQINTKKSFVQYNSYHSLIYLENNDYYLFSNQLVRKQNWKKYNLCRGPFEQHDLIINTYTNGNDFYYLTEDENERNLYLFSNLKSEKVKCLTDTKNNYLTMEYQNRIDIQDNILGIIGDGQDCYIIYPNRMEDKKGNILYETNFTRNFSVYKNEIYVLEENNTIKIISLDNFKSRIYKKILCDYFYFKDDNFYIHSIYDNKLYCNNKKIINKEVMWSDMYKNILIYSDSKGMYKVNLATNEESVICTEEVYSLKISNDGEYLSYITKSNLLNKTLKFSVFDLKKENIVYVQYE